MPTGQTYTVPLANYLAGLYQGSSRQVYYDHGPDSLRIYSWFGPKYTPPHSARHLAWMDIVIADPQTKDVYQIIEVEDTSSRPKTILGDIMAVLLGDGLSFAGKNDWQIGEWTTCFVLCKASSQSSTAQVQLDYMQHQITAILPHLGTGNARIGQIILGQFTDLADLQAFLTRG